MLVIGTVIDGEYSVEATLGGGAFGVVYRCQEIRLQRTVALKLLHAASPDQKELQRFLNEGRLLASLSHPNVIHIYRLGYHAETPYIVMEFLEGKTLRQHLSGDRMPVKQTLTVMHQVASGLQAIHAAGVIHRDLSANNVMVTDRGQAKILDLGLARNLSAMSTASQYGYLVGTIAYVSPEQVEGRMVTAASDLFSLGVLLYESLSGKNPFEAEHPMSMLYNIANREAKPLEEYVENLPPGLLRLVRDCLEKDPQERPRDAAAVEKALLEILAAPEIDSSRRILATEKPSGRATPKNPYLNRTMIRRREDFFGRTQEMRRIYARLNANPPGSVSLVGDRKIGKSSLLNSVYLRHNRESYLEQPEKMVMVFLDLQEEKNMSISSFVRILMRMIAYELRGRLEIPKVEHDLDGVKSVVEQLHTHGFRLAILLDEFEAITSNPNFVLEFFSFLRFLANHYNVAYLTSSARDLQVLCHTKEISDSPFFNIFSTMRLSVFRPEEAEELIRVPSERAGRPLAAYSETILEMAGLFPFLLQIVCSHTVDVLEENPGRRDPDFHEVRRRFYEEAKLHYRYLWSNLDIHERSAIRRVAYGKSVPSALRHVLQELEVRHLVESVSGFPKLFSGSFQEFVKENRSEDSPPSFLKRLLGRS